MLLNLEAKSFFFSLVEAAMLRQLAAQLAFFFNGNYGRFSRLKTDNQAYVTFYRTKSHIPNRHDPAQVSIVVKSI